MTAAAAHRAILAVWRIEQPRLITRLARMLRDVPLAEEMTQDALMAALERWPDTGVPERPGAGDQREVCEPVIGVLGCGGLDRSSPVDLAQHVGLDGHAAAPR